MSQSGRALGVKIAHRLQLLPALQIIEKHRTHDTHTQFFHVTPVMAPPLDMLTLQTSEPTEILSDD